MISNKKKLVIIGLDCATPKTLFEDFLDDCPNIKKMVEQGVYGKLRTCDPPITIPAWMVMSTGKKAGTLGIFNSVGSLIRSVSTAIGGLTIANTSISFVILISAVFPLLSILVIFFSLKD